MSVIPIPHAIHLRERGFRFGTETSNGSLRHTLRLPHDWRPPQPIVPLYDVQDVEDRYMSIRSADTAFACPKTDRFFLSGCENVWAVGDQAGQLRLFVRETRESTNQRHGSRRSAAYDAEVEEDEESEQGCRIHAIGRHLNAKVSALSFANMDAWLASGDGDGVVATWDIETRALTTMLAFRVPGSHRGQGTTPSLSPLQIDSIDSDGRSLLAVGVTTTTSCHVAVLDLRVPYHTPVYQFDVHDSEKESYTSRAPIFRSMSSNLRSYSSTFGVFQQFAALSGLNERFLPHNYAVYSPSVVLDICADFDAGSQSSCKARFVGSAAYAYMLPSKATVGCGEHLDSFVDAIDGLKFQESSYEGASRGHGCTTQGLAVVVGQTCQLFTLDALHSHMQSDRYMQSAHERQCIFDEFLTNAIEIHPHLAEREKTSIRRFVKCRNASALGISGENELESACRPLSDDSSDFPRYGPTSVHQCQNKHIHDSSGSSNMESGSDSSSGSSSDSDTDTDSEAQSLTMDIWPRRLSSLSFRVDKLQLRMNALAEVYEATCAKLSQRAYPCPQLTPAHVFRFAGGGVQPESISTSAQIRDSPTYQPMNRLGFKVMDLHATGAFALCTNSTSESDRNEALYLNIIASGAYHFGLEDALAFRLVIPLDCSEGDHVRVHEAQFIPEVQQAAYQSPAVPDVLIFCAIVSKVQVSQKGGNNDPSAWFVMFRVYMPKISSVQHCGFAHEVLMKAPLIHRPQMLPLMPPIYRFTAFVRTAYNASNMEESLLDETLTEDHQVLGGAKRTYSEFADRYGHTMTTNGTRQQLNLYHFVADLPSTHFDVTRLLAPAHQFNGSKFCTKLSKTFQLFKRDRPLLSNLTSACVTQYRWPRVVLIRYFGDVQEVCAVPPATHQLLPFPVRAATFGFKLPSTMSRLAMHSLMDFALGSANTKFVGRYACECLQDGSRDIIRRKKVQLLKGIMESDPLSAQNFVEVSKQTAQFTPRGKTAVLRARDLLDCIINKDQIGSSSLQPSQHRGTGQTIRRIFETTPRDDNPPQVDRREIRRLTRQTEHSELDYTAYDSDLSRSSTPHQTVLPGARSVLQEDSQVSENDSPEHLVEDESDEDTAYDDDNEDDEEEYEGDQTKRFVNIPIILDVPIESTTAYYHIFHMFKQPRDSNSVPVDLGEGLDEETASTNLDTVTCLHQGRFQDAELQERDISRLQAFLPKVFSR